MYKGLCQYKTKYQTDYNATEINENNKFLKKGQIHSEG